MELNKTSLDSLKDRYSPPAKKTNSLLKANVLIPTILLLVLIVSLSLGAMIASNSDQSLDTTSRAAVDVGAGDKNIEASVVNANFPTDSTALNPGATYTADVQLVAPTNRKIAAYDLTFQVSGMTVESYEPKGGKLTTELINDASSGRFVYGSSCTNTGCELHTGTAVVGTVTLKATAAGNGVGSFAVSALEVASLNENDEAFNANTYDTAKLTQLAYTFAQTGNPTPTTAAGTPQPTVDPSGNVCFADVVGDDNRILLFDYGRYIAAFSSSEFDEGNCVNDANSDLSCSIDIAGPAGLSPNGKIDLFDAGVIVQIFSLDNYASANGDCTKLSLN